MTCTRAESLAGAIALGEASPADRETYRRHLAGCDRCLAELGGERELERAAAMVAQARDEERWEPSIRLGARTRRANGWTAWRYGVAVVAVAILAFAGSRALQPSQPVPGTARNVVVYAGTHPSQRDERAIASMGNTRTTPLPVHHAEAIALLGRGESVAIPGTGFEIQVDRDGRARACRITHSSGYPALDRAVCRAALRQHFR